MNIKLKIKSTNSDAAAVIQKCLFVRADGIKIRMKERMDERREADLGSCERFFVCPFLL